MTMYAQVTLATTSMDTADYLTNGFAIQGGPIEGQDLDNWATAIKDFYDDVNFLGGMCGCVQDGHVIKFYEIGNGPPNYPVDVQTFDFASAPADVQMPMEVALCISYANTTLNTVPRARRRGRIYLGGWAESFNDAGRPVEANLTSLATAYKTYADTVNTIDTVAAGIWSRANDFVYAIDTIWVDNEWDIQRRRGGKATERFTVTVA